MKFLISALIVLQAATTSGYTIQAPWNSVKANPSLRDHAKAQANTFLKFRLNVGSKANDPNRLLINNLLIELQNDDDNNLLSDHPKLPGANGPRPNLSSGVMPLRVIEEGSFIDMKGKQNVKLLNGCWEMVWRDDAFAGAIICGFEAPEESKRNDATLPAGRLFMTFPVWDKNGLEESKAYKHNIETRANKFLKDRDEAVSKAQDTNNPLMKALHYRDAFSAYESYQMTGVKAMTDVPLDDVIPIKNGLMMCSKGTVWTKTEKIFATSQHLLLGSAEVFHGLQP